MITAKREADTKKVVKEFESDPELRILNGRYGVYISFKKSNYKIPKTVTSPETLTIEECMEIINSQESKPKKATRRATSKKK